MPMMDKIRPDIAAALQPERCAGTALDFWREVEGTPR